MPQALGGDNEEVGVDLRERCEKNLPLFCETYFPKSFFNPWIEGQDGILSALHRVILGNSVESITADRGVGTSTLIQAATLWASLYGHSRYTIVVYSKEVYARRVSENLDCELSNNRRLVADFPIPGVVPSRIDPVSLDSFIHGQHAGRNASRQPDLVLFDLPLRAIGKNPRPVTEAMAALLRLPPRFGCLFAHSISD